MASLSRHGDVFHIRFRFRNRSYRRTLKTEAAQDAQGALHVVGKTIHQLRLGLLQVPPGLDPGDFIVSGGTLRPTVSLKQATTRELTALYLKAEQQRISESFVSSKQTHLNHLLEFLAKRADQPTRDVSEDDLRRYRDLRCGKVQETTVNKELVTLKHLYEWAVAEKYLEQSPAAGLVLFKCEVDRDRFKTVAEIEQILERGGLSEQEQLNVWDCLYLTPQEIAAILSIVQANAVDDISFLLHAVPAYTGMRRGEILRLRWTDVDLEKAFLIARSRKQSRTKREVQRQIELHPDLQKELLTWRKRHPKGQLVFCNAATLEPLPKGHANQRFWQPLRGTTWCLDRAKNWYKIGFHSYRHSFASNLAAAGVDQRITDAFMGHQTEEMRRRYQHLYPKNRQSAILALQIHPTISSLTAELAGSGK